MEKHPLRTLLINSSIIFIIFWLLFFLEKFQLVETKSAVIYFVIALLLAFIDLLISTKLIKWLAELKDKNLDQ